MVLFGIEGLLGSGKTLSLTFLGLFYYIAGYDIKANFQLTIPYEHIVDLIQLELNNPNPTLFLLDEMWDMIDARGSQRTTNKIMNAILLASRKRKSSIGYTQQGHTQTDKRIRIATNYWIYPYFLEEGNLRLEIYDKAGNKTLLTVDPKIFWHLYNTDEIIDFTEMKQNILKSKNDEYLESVKEYLSLNPQYYGLTKDLLSATLLKDGFTKTTLNKIIINDFLKNKPRKKR